MDGNSNPQGIKNAEYLTFEGGGGKGNAYVGAIKALEEQGVLAFSNSRLTSIKGISGSSAGAITAMLVASGHSYAEIRQIITQTDFNKFFDDPVPGDKFYAGSSAYTNPNQSFKSYLKSSTLARTGSLLNFFFNDDKESIEFYKSVINKKPGYPDDYALCLLVDYGLFSGKAVHSFLVKTLKNKVDKISQSQKQRDISEIQPGVNTAQLSFSDFYDIFEVDLKITSVNMRTENLQILSKDTTPKFSVATAVRMSMSIPAVYKPVIINDNGASKFKLDNFWKGTWIDGGLFDNAPIRVFDPNKTLLLRLGDRSQNNPLKSLTEYLKVWLKNIGALGSGSGQTTQTTFIESRVIQLNVDGLTLLKFNLDPDTFEKVEEKNYQIVTQYFTQQSR